MSRTARFRRRRWRWPVYGLAAVVGLTVLALAIFHVPGVQQAAVRFSLAKLRPVIGADIQFREFYVNLLTGTLRVTGLAITGPERSVDGAPLRSRIAADEAFVDAAISRLVRGQIRVERVAVSQPEVDLIVAADGQLIHPFYKPGPAEPEPEPEQSSSGGLPNITVARIELTGGAARVLPEVGETGLTVGVSGIGLDGSLSLASLQTAGTLAITDASYTQRGQTAKLTDTNLNWNLAAGGTGPVSLRTALGQLDAVVTAELAGVLSAPSYDGTIKISGDLTPVSVFLPPAQAMAGTVDIHARARGTFSGPPVEASAEIAGSGLAIMGWQAATLALTAGLKDGELNSSSLDVQAAGGELSLSASGRLFPELGELRVAAQLRSLRLPELLRPLALPVDARGQITGSVAGTINIADINASNAQLDLTIEQAGSQSLAATLPEAAAPVIAPALDIVADWSDGTLKLQRLELTDSVLRIAGSGELNATAKTFGIALEASATDIGPYLALAGQQGGGQLALDISGNGPLPTGAAPLAGLTANVAASGQNITVAGQQINEVAFEASASGNDARITRGRIVALGFAADLTGRARIPLPAEGGGAGEGSVELDIPTWTYEGKALPPVAARASLGDVIQAQLTMGNNLTATVSVPNEQPITAAAELNALPIELANAFLPPTLPKLGGTVTGSARASIPAGAPVGATVNLSEVNLTLGEKDIRTAAPLAVEFANNVLVIKSLSLQSSDATLITAAGSIDTAKQQLDLSLQAKIPEAGSWADLFTPAPLGLSAAADITVAVTGPFAQPIPQGNAVVNAIRFQDMTAASVSLAMAGGSGSELIADVDIRGLAWQGRAARDSAIRAIYDGNSLQANASLQDGQVLANVALPDLNSALLDGTVTFTRFDIGEALRLAGVDLHLDGLLNGVIEVDGPYDDPAALRAAVNFDTLQAGGYDLAVSNAGPVAINLSQGIAAISSFELRGEGFSLSASGSVNVAELTGPAGPGAGAAPQLDLRVNATANANAFLQFVPALDQLSGTVRANVRARGAAAAPELTGTVTVSKAAVGGPDIPVQIQDISGAIDLAPHQISIQEFAARVGGGQVKVGGKVGLKDLVPDAIDMSVFMRGVAVSMPEIELSVDGDLTANGNMSKLAIGGEVRVLEAIYAPDLNLLEILMSAARPAAPEVDRTAQETQAQAMELVFDIGIVAPDSIRVQNPSVDLDLTAKIQLAGSSAAPSVLGAVIIHRGYLNLLGSEFDLKKGTLRFTDARTIDPQIDITAVTRPDAQITLKITGQASQPQLQLSSASGLSDMEIAKRLVGKMGASDNSGSADTMQMVSQYATQGIANALADTLSLRTDLKIVPFPTTAEGEAFLVGVGKQINDKLSVMYYKSATSSQGDAIEAELELTPTTQLQARQNRDGSISGGLRFRHEFH